MSIEEIISNLRESNENSKPENIPEGCRACGGPYPSCKSACNMFED